MRSDVRFDTHNGWYASARSVCGPHVREKQRRSELLVRGPSGTPSLVFDGLARRRHPGNQNPRAAAWPDDVKGIAAAGTGSGRVAGAWQPW